MAWGGYIPGSMLRDPEFVARMLPGAEDWFPEDDSVNDEYPEDWKEEGTVYRIVSSKDEPKDWAGNKSARFRKPYYTTLGGARRALCYFPEGSEIQEGEVTWRKLSSSGS